MWLKHMSVFVFEMYDFRSSRTHNRTSVTKNLNIYNSYLNDTRYLITPWSHSFIINPNSLQTSYAYFRSFLINLVPILSFQETIVNLYHISLAFLIFALQLSYSLRSIINSLYIAACHAHYISHRDHLFKCAFHSQSFSILYPFHPRHMHALTP